VIYFADLHIHSRFSRATSKDCNLVELARWAAFKGIRVLATGDCTHPDWSREIRDILEEAEEGLFRLKTEHVPSMERLPGGFGPEDVRFMLNVEISSIYKKNGATRKVHNLVFLPDLESMERLNARLDRIGNIKSDGRPILGLDSRDLLEIALETTSESFLVPAHVWTPWFSILGSRSGFDSVEECFEDLSPHIFALETGLSSDPEMNRKVGSLDGYTLISNSDTHSPANLGREVNILDGVPGYVAIREAIRAGGGGRRIEPGAESPLESMRGSSMTQGSSSGPREGKERGFIGTIEFFPEEGKYHLDGHRKCSLRLDPEQTEKLEGMCPVCGRPVTVGVMNRVMELADRPTDLVPDRGAPFWRMIPLAEIVSQAVGVGPKSKKVTGIYMDLLKKLGPELMILWSLPAAEISRGASEIVAEGIFRVRRGEVSIQGGYDGEYGTVKLFTADERDLFGGQSSLMPVERVAPRGKPKAGRSRRRTRKTKKAAASGSSEKRDDSLNEEQSRAVSTCEVPVLVKAGPGTGKTRTLVHRAAALISDGKALSEEITAVTFTRKAAKEMADRLGTLLPVEKAERCWVGTFHQLGTRIIDFFRKRNGPDDRDKVLDRDEALAAFRQAVKDAGLKIPPSGVIPLFNEVSLLKQNLVEPDHPLHDEDLSRAYRVYEEHLRRSGAFDLDDLLVHAVRILRDSPSLASHARDTWARHFMVDEFQDVNRAQYEMVRLLARSDGRGLFVIGDPDQAIYGFRGSDRRFFLRFREDYPSSAEIHLKRNYRSQGTILEAAQAVLNDKDTAEPLLPEIPGGRLVKVVRLPNPVTEGIFITRTIDAMLGGSSFLSLDSGRVDVCYEEGLGLEDFAVLYRLNAVGDALEEAFRSSGIPVQRARKNTPVEEAEALDPRAEAVTLMTMHASKGLEFPVVFVAGCEEGVIPYTRNDEQNREPTDLNEERRLLYVAMTRAKMDLFLTGSRTRSLFGRKFDTSPSSFLDPVENDLFEFLNPLAGRPTERQDMPVQCELFQ